MWYNITLAIGLFLFGLSLYIFKNAMSFVRKSERTEATVIDLERIPGSDGDTFKPVFTYKPNQGQTLEYRSMSSSRPPSWKLGEKAVIAYDPADPSSAKLLTYFGVFGPGIVLLALALPFIVVGGGYHVSQYLLR
jgi:hypothetical protein